MRKLLAVLFVLAWCYSAQADGRYYAAPAAGGASNCGGAGSGQGYSDTGSASYSDDMPYKVYATSITASATCVANKIRWYGVTGTSSKLKMEIKDSTSNVAAYTGEASVPSSAGWVSASLNTPVTFTQGNTYWLVAMGDAGSSNRVYAITSGGTTVYETFTSTEYNGWPFAEQPDANSQSWKIMIEAYYE